MFVQSQNPDLSNAVASRMLVPPESTVDRSKMCVPRGSCPLLVICIQNVIT